MNNTEIVNAILASRTACTAAFEVVLPEIRRLPASKVRTVNVDLVRTVSRVLGALPGILKLRNKVEQMTREVEFVRLQKLETYSYAAQEAYLRCLAAGKPPDELRALAHEGDALRTMLRSDATALINRGLLDPKRLASCQGQPGYRTIATDLGLFASVMLTSWSEIGCRTCVSQQELERAKAIAEALLLFVGVRELTHEARLAAVDVRDRAFTLLADNYEEARRVVTFVCWYDGNADVIAPSLYAGRQRRKRKTSADNEKGQISPTPAVPAAAPSANATAPVESASSNPVPAVVSVGSPNSNPFMH